MMFTNLAYAHESGFGCIFMYAYTCVFMCVSIFLNCNYCKLLDTEILYSIDSYYKDLYHTMVVLGCERGVWEVNYSAASLWICVFVYGKF